MEHLDRLKGGTYSYYVCTIEIKEIEGFLALIGAINLPCTVSYSLQLLYNRRVCCLLGVTLHNAPGVWTDKIILG